MPNYYSSDCPWYSQRNKIKKVVIENEVTNIGANAFKDCSDLISITIPNSVTSIGSYAFQECYSLTSVTIPNSVTSISENTFYGCYSLTSVTIPNSVTSIGSNAFGRCSGLTSITIPNSVTSIGYQSFYSCSGLTSITIPNSVTSIESSAFYMCSGLTSVTIPNSVTSIGNFVFSFCSALTSVTIPNSVTRIGNYAFSNSNSLSSVTIPESVTAIGEGAFMGCNKLTSIIIPKSVTNIGPKAFYNSRNIASLTCEAIVPPTCSAECFAGIKNSIPVYVPASSINEYKTANQWKDFTNIQAIIDNQSIANAVIEKIDAIGKVEYTDASKGKIDEANTAYDALTDEQKALVTNLDVLTTAQQTYDNLKAAAEKLAADKTKADAVIAKINAIGTVEYTDACKGKIDEASTAYNALSADQKALVTNLDVLTTAKQTYDNLKAAADKLAADKAAANAVIAKINAIGKVEYTYACKDKIDDANNAYNDLTADQKALVSNLDVLTTAKQTYDNLKAAAEKLAADKAAFDQYKSEQKAIIEALIKEDDSDAVKDIIKKAISDIDALGYEEAISLDDNKEKLNTFVTSVNEVVEKQRAEDQKTTSIDELGFAEKANIFDLNGRKITNSMLKSGLYIRNGKKVVVK